jgi:hypothetical protein
MSILTPEQRPDKNGTVVTRWVKPQGTGKGAALGIPAPAMPTTRFNRDTFDKEVSEVIGDRKYEDDDFTTFIKRSKDETLQYVYDAIMDNADKEDMLSAICGIMHDGVEDDVAVAFIATYDRHDGLMDDNGIVDYLRGALESGSNLPEKYDPSDEQRNQELHNLYLWMIECDSMRHLSDEREVKGVMSGLLPARSYKLRDDNLADMIRFNPEKASSMQELINSESFTPGAYLYALDHPEDVPQLVKALEETPEYFKDRDAAGVAAIMEGYGDRSALTIGKL